MSDKKQPEKSNDDNTTADTSSNDDNQTNLSASIKLTQAEKKSSTTDKVASTDKAESASKPIPNKNKDNSTATVKNSAASSHTTSDVKAATMKKADDEKKKTKISKIAVLALIIALLAICASVGHYFWIEQQKAQSSSQINSEVQKILAVNQKKIAQQLLQNKQAITQQFQQSNRASANELTALKRELAQRHRFEEATLATISQLQQQVASLGQKQPSEWSLQEAEYLIRVASRSLWLEKDARTAISLLNDADMRVEELNDPQYLSLRQTIQQDIAALQVLPKLATDNVILKLMTLDQQIKDLPLVLFEIPDNSESKASLELTDNVSDWQENLAKVWRKFSAKYFTFTPRSGDVEPLMSATFQQNLRENLSLKVQTAIWAASKGNDSIYLQALSDIQRWLNDYFDMKKTINQNFDSTLESLKVAVVTVEYPNSLAALKKIRQILSSKSQPKTNLLNQASSAEKSAAEVIAPTSVEQGEGI